VAATPAARRVAREAGVALASVQGSGPHGRVQVADIVSQPVQTAPQMAPSVGEAGRAAQVVPLSPKRRVIAERLTASFRDVPHFTLSVEIDVTALEAWRGRLNALAQAASEAKVTLTAVVVKGLAWALERNPYLNASLQGDKIYLWQDINIGVATALPEGLIVPVVRQANFKPVREIAKALNDLALRARENRLALSDVQHGTFTLSNLGMYGVHTARAVINPPECAILAVGTMVRKPVVINNRDDIAVRPMMTFTLSADHRVVDGAVGARFLDDLAKGLANPDVLLY
jgi:pyruvate dehydrogenase E2 component (dihydrolipoamide acetyltransferase)